MMQCLSLKSSSSTSSAALPPPHPPHSQGNSTPDTPRSSAQASPAVNLPREYTLNVQSNSYNEIWSRIHPTTTSTTTTDHNEETHQLLLAQVLHPNRECVEDALRDAKSNTLTALVKAYFDHSENATHLCLLLHQSIYRARLIYNPLHALLEVLPLDSDSQSHSSLLTQSQCNRAFDIFLQFHGLDNPFPSPDSHNFNEMRDCFSQLKQQLDSRIRKSRSRIRRATASSAICFVCTAVGAAVSAVVIAARTLVAGSFRTAYLAPPHKFTHKEAAHLAQLDAALRGTYVLNNELDTIDRLVARLHNAVDNDKLLIRLGLDRGREKHPIMEVIKQLRKSHLNFRQLLQDLEEHICLCFNTVNRARALLLKEVYLHQSLMSRDYKHGQGAQLAANSHENFVQSPG
ncbi:UPF0496 protein At3g19330-like [Alnus glutinosa]|uniref:UPF0496 protein At3g19330-like n=1 Tax=Alnus glutinosa TaxID=3517 RepID=UPI002D768413|nr:UPF0496 protein At3g19330-like [Alnus glutinosa]XP_062151754.1 UPF0496 protein At3g19330-like [Alnus glutinosa]